MNWLNDERIKLYPRCFIGLYVVIYLYLALPGLIGPERLDRLGNPVGMDFSGFYAASSLASTQNPAAVFNLERMQEAIDRVIGGKSDFSWYWIYPPNYLLALLPASYLPYFASLALWLSLTLCGYLLVIGKIAPHPSSYWLALAFPGTFANFYQGQNGFLSAMLLGAGLLLLERAPFIGGLLFGLLCYKPQLAMLIPVALLAGRYWRALGGMIAGTLAFVLLSFLVLGTDIWLEFWHSLPFARQVLEMQMWMGSTLSAAKLAGAPPLIARILQGLVMLASLAIIVWAWSKQVALPVRSSVLVLGLLLSTPYFFPHELALLALPLALMGWEGYTKGWLPGEQPLLILAWLLPLFAFGIAKLIHLQLVPIVLAGLLFFAIKRVKQEATRAGAESRLSS